MVTRVEVPDERVQAPTRLLTEPEVEDILQRKRTAIFEAVRSGELVAVRLGRSLRFRPEDVDRYIARNLTSDVA